MARKLQYKIADENPEFSGAEMKKLCMLMCFAVTCAVGANADVIANGPGAVTGSWTQAWVWQGTTVTSFEFDMLSGSAWEHPIHSFSNDWVSTGFRPNVITA